MPRKSAAKMPKGRTLEEVEAEASNLTDFDGDGTPGGSLPQLAWDTAETAWGACHAWAMVKGVDNPSWKNLSDGERNVMAAFAFALYSRPDWVGKSPLFPETTWESGVRAKIFAAVVRSIAL